jgi:hypothetical protein
MEVSTKLFSLGFVYNAKGNIFAKRQIPESPIPDNSFFKHSDGVVEMYAPTPNSEGMWDHLIMTSDFKEVLKEETITEQTILDL